MRVTTKGQVTIPKEIRDHLGIVPGTDVEFVREKGEVRLVAANKILSDDEKKMRFREALARQRGVLDLQGMTSDEYFQWIRGPGAEVDPD